jgi:hypothetical protein
VLRKGFAGGYCRKFVKVSNDTQLHEQPAKNSFSHPHDALQYLLLGGGERNVVMQRMNRGGRRMENAQYDVRTGQWFDKTTGATVQMGGGQLSTEYEPFDHMS